MKQQLKQNMDKLMAQGATYVDARWYPSEESNSLLMWNGNLKNLSASSQSGVGVRVLYHGAWGFSAASSLEDTAAIFEKALDNARTAAERVDFPVRLAEKDAVRASFVSPNRVDPFTVPLTDKLEFLRMMDTKLNQSGVAQRVAALDFVKRQIVFMDSEGSEIDKTIIDVFPTFEVMGIDKDGEMQSRKYKSARQGSTRGWESWTPNISQVRLNAWCAN